MVLDFTKRNDKSSFWVNIPGTQRSLPVTIIYGVKRGKTALITAGVHCCEYVGVEAISLLTKELKPEQINGNVVMIHCIDYLGFLQHNRDKIPEDQKNLNKVFPGEPQGTTTQIIADFLTKEFLSASDYVVDLHSGGYNESLRPHAYYKADCGAVSEKSLMLARSADIACAVQVKSNNGLYSHAAEMGIPAILLERGESGLIRKGEPEAAAEDIKRILRYTGILRDGIEEQKFPVVDVNEAFYLDAQFDGCWYPAFLAGDHFTQGAVLGVVKDLFGEVLQVVVAQKAGMVLYQTASLSVAANDPLVAYAVL